MALPAPVEIAASAALMVLTLRALRGGLTGRGPREFFRLDGYDPFSLLLGILAIAWAVSRSGVMGGIALILAIMIHEYGHVLAYRVCGHDDARFRLIPVFGGVAISNRLPASHETDFFITLMGPAFCLAPMLLSVSLMTEAYALHPQIGFFLLYLGQYLALLNAFNILPLWPLDGGRLVRVLVQSLAPGATRAVSIAMSATAAALAVFNQSWILLIFVLLGWAGLRQSEAIAATQRPMPPRRALLAVAAYLATAGVFLIAGWPLILGLVMR